MTTATVKSSTKSISANGTVLFNPKVPDAQDQQYSQTLNGYTPVAIIGYTYSSNSNHVQQLNPYRARLILDSGKWYVDFAVKETTGNAFSAYVEFSILYILEEELLRG